MARRYSRQRYKSKYEDVTVLITAKIKRIEVHDQLIGDKFKTVFYINNKDGNELMCIKWGHTTIREGDSIEIKGRYTDDKTLLCWSLMITERAIQ